LGAGERRKQKKKNKKKSLCASFRGRQISKHNAQTARLAMTARVNSSLVA